MKKCILLLLCLITEIIFCQNRHAVVVYLSDAETAKNVNDAKVTLEGFEVPAIAGSYDKKGRYYYFDKIPVGYNTIMAYHDKYNEKGYQNLTALPKKIRLKLYDPLSISFDFEKPYIANYNCCNNGKKTNYAVMPKYLKQAKKSSRKIKKKTFRYLYKEDPNYIAIIISSKEERNSITELLDRLSLEEINYNNFGSQNFVLDSEKGCLADGSIARNPGNTEVIIIKKKDGTKFSRFNSFEIKSLRAQGLIVACLTSRVLEYYGDVFFNAAKFYAGQSLFNTNFSYPRSIDQAFSATRNEDYKQYFGDRINNMSNDNLYSADDDRLYSVFFVISNDKNDGTGLGVLDNMGIAEIKNKTYIFTNNYKLKK